jgi:hypothetical protein
MRRDPQRIGGPLRVTRPFPSCHDAYMVHEELRCGEKYGFRERPRFKTVPLECIQLLKHIRGRKWQARWIDTHPGLVDYINSVQIVIPWSERKAFLQEERDHETMGQHNEDVGFLPTSPLSDAIHSIFENIGESAHFDINHGSMSGSIDVIERLRVRAKLAEADLSPSSSHAYVERSGRLRLPYECALKFARAFCMQEPAGVLASLEASERDFSLRSTNPDNGYLIPLLNEFRASWAIVRQWCGLDAAIAIREKRISDLERLVWDAVYVLQKTGNDLEAAKLRRRLE